MIFDKYFSQFKKFDWILFSTVVILVVFGLLAIYSISVNTEEGAFSLLITQGIAFGLGLILLFTLAFFDYRILRGYANIIYWVGVALLLGVLFFGITVRGTRGWYSIFGQVFQPVEIVKILVIIFLARYLAHKASEPFSFKSVLISGLFIALPVVLVLLQPDLGSALIFIAIWIGMTWLTRIKKSHIFMILGVMLVTIFVSWFFLADYQKDRVLTFIQPTRDPLEQGYNVSQSIISVGSGQIWGRGLSLGPQSRLNFLPAKETDFVFAVIAEELGFIGSLFVISAFGFLFWRIIKIIRAAQDDFGIYVAWGILVMITVQMFINIGMNLGLAPVAGLPLPFISAGGSSLMMSLLSIGIIESIYSRRKSLKL
ncbi:rod shape-determining protein RodA [Patescibacteria group bacterium]|nr:rod shape-determining protein RodA [Patescibacteria group bacterium]MBU1074985.1 rod shape-determining protein RodA [Patescibacteria group bacterium]MBU1951306.1 rod shape-determining protein RodA [Patescibacteria group bacterium]